MIDTSDSEIIYSGEYGQEEFSITFPYASPDDIKVYIADSDVPLAASEYSITNNKVVLSAPLEEEATVRITRETSLTQETQYINQGTTDLTRIEHSFDKLTMIAQENHNSMATVDSRVNSNMSSIASSAADLAASNVSANLSTFIDEAYFASAAIAIYVENINSISSAISSDVNTVGGYVSTVNSASSYISNASSAINEMSGGISVMSSGISEISGNIAGMSSGVSVMSSGIMDVSAYVSSAAESIAVLSAGNGIALSGGVVSAKVDSSTIGFDSNGALSCSVSGSAIPYVGSNGIDVNGTVISAKLDGSTISTNASGELQCLVSGGGQSYSAGAGIVISGGGISLDSDALAQVPQTIPASGGRVVQQESSGGYLNFNSNGGVTIGTGNTYRLSAGADAVAMKTSTSTGLFGSGNTVQLSVSGAARVNASGNYTYMYGTTTAGAIRVYALGNSGTVSIKKNNGSYEEALTESSYATSNTPGIVRPDNSTCTVDSGGVLHCLSGGGLTSVNASGGISANIVSGGLNISAEEDLILKTPQVLVSSAFEDGNMFYTYCGFNFHNSNNPIVYAAKNQQGLMRMAGTEAYLSGSSLVPTLELTANNYNSSGAVIQSGFTKETRKNDQITISGEISNISGDSSSASSYDIAINNGGFTMRHPLVSTDLTSSIVKFRNQTPYEGFESYGGIIYADGLGNGGIGWGQGSDISCGVQITANPSEITKGGVLIKTKENTLAVPYSGNATYNNFIVLNDGNLKDRLKTNSPLVMSGADNDTKFIELSYDSTVMSTTGAGALTLISTPSDAVVSNFDSGGEFSRVHAGGFCIQGGHREAITSSTQNGEVVVSLHTPFRDSSYIVQDTPIYDPHYGGVPNAKIYSKTASTFIVKGTENVNNDSGGDWVAIGFVS